MTNEETENENTETAQVTLTQKELQQMTQSLMGGALQIDNLDSQTARTIVMQESWDLTQLLIKQKVRETRKAINDDILSFLNSFPEALEAIKTGLGITVDLTTNEEE
tara:strand:- start:4947 stop:5267 length:321 start_codon:yes stop_codon:yes gene_type:complete